MARASRNRQNRIFGLRMNYVHLKRWLDCEKEQAFGSVLEQENSRKSTLRRCCGRHLLTDLLTGSVDTLRNTASPR